MRAASDGARGKRTRTYVAWGAEYLFLFLGFHRIPGTDPDVRVEIIELLDRPSPPMAFLMYANVDPALLLDTADPADPVDKVLLAVLYDAREFVLPERAVLNDPVDPADPVDLRDRAEKNDARELIRSIE